MRWISGFAAGLLVAVLLPVPGPAQQADLEGALAGKERAADDRARDAGRRPAEVVDFLGIRPGMHVIDLIAAGGYYTEVLSLAVGPEGVVYAQNPKAVLEFRDGANDEALTARLAGDRLANVKRLDVPLADVPIEPGSLDAAITALNFHDLYYGRSREVAAAFLARVHELLKPGGVLGLIDHAGDAGGDNAELHRIEESLVDELVRAAGFEVEKSDLLRNPEDDRTKNVFDPALRGKTDRFLMKLVKPAA